MGRSAGSGPRARALPAAIAVAALLTVATGAAAEQDIERFLPANTFLYLGMEKLGPAFDGLTGLIGRYAPVPPGQKFEDMVILVASQALGVLGVQGRDDLMAQVGLDPDGAAGVAWVPGDPARDLVSNENLNFLVVVPTKDAIRVEARLLSRVLPALLAAQPRAPGPPPGPLTREQLGERRVGDVTVVGGRAKGAGYALTPSHLVVSNNVSVLEDAVAAATDGEAVLAFMPGKCAEGTPNLLLVIGFRDRQAVQPIEGLFLTEARKEFGDWAVTRADVDGVRVTSVRAEADLTVHYVVAGRFVAVGTRRPDVLAVAAIQAGRGAANGPRSRALIASEKSRDLGLTPGRVNALMFFDAPRYITEWCKLEGHAPTEEDLMGGSLLGTSVLCLRFEGSSISLDGRAIPLPQVMTRPQAGPESAIRNP